MPGGGVVNTVLTVRRSASSEQVTSSILKVAVTLCTQRQHKGCGTYHCKCLTGAPFLHTSSATFWGCLAVLDLLF